MLDTNITSTLVYLLRKRIPFVTLPICMSFCRFYQLGNPANFRNIIFARVWRHLLTTTNWDIYSFTNRLSLSCRFVRVLSVWLIDNVNNIQKNRLWLKSKENIHISIMIRKYSSVKLITRYLVSKENSTSWSCILACINSGCIICILLKAQISI